MAKVTELIEALYARGVTSGPLLKDQLDRSIRQTYHSNHLKAKVGEKSPHFIRKEGSTKKKPQRKGPTNITFERINPKDEDWEKKLEKIMKKIRSCMREKSLLDSIDVIIDISFTEEIIACPNTNKLKPLPIDRIIRPRTLWNLFKIFVLYALSGCLWPHVVLHFPDYVLLGCPRLVRDLETKLD